MWYLVWLIPVYFVAAVWFVGTCAFLWEVIFCLPTYWDDCAFDVLFALFWLPLMLYWLASGAIEEGFNRRAGSR